MEARFVVGPPGTGKTHIFLVEKYEEGFSKYNPEEIILLSHTNVAVEQILDAIMELKQVKEKGYRRKFFKDRICTIHHYCRHKLIRRELFSEDDFKNLREEHREFRVTKVTNSEKHPALKFIKDARGHERTLEEHWNHKNTDNSEYSPYNINNIKKIKKLYEDYKNKNRVHDYADMIDEFNSLSKESTVEMLIVDEAQDANIPQLTAIKKIAKNVRDNHFYLVGDPDQTIYEYAGSDADYFHKAAAKPFLELKKGLRCGKAINEFCKTIISPVWKHYGYERTWLPKEGVEGKIYSLSNFNPSKNLDILMDKMRNTKQRFLFSFRGTPSHKLVTKFLEHHGFEYAHVDNTAHVSKKELRSHFEWPKFIDGESKSLVQIKNFHYYLGSKAVVRGRGEEKFEGWIKKDYSYNELINSKLFLPDLNKNFDLLRKQHKGIEKKEHVARMIYIKKVLVNGFDFDGDIRIKYGNIHKVKGTTFDNVVGDLTLYRGKPEPRYVQLRLKYTMFSRGINDAWVLKSQTGKELGNYGPVR